MKVFTKYILALIFSMAVLVCFSQVEYDGFSKKEMKVLLLKRDSIIKSQEIQITAFKDLTANLNLKLKIKQDSIDALIENYKSMISEMNALQSNLAVVKKEKLDLTKEKVDLLNEKSSQAKLHDNVKLSLEKQISNTLVRLDSLNDEFFKLNSQIVILENDLLECNNNKRELLVSTDLLNKSIVNLNLINDSLEKELKLESPKVKGNTSDVLNSVYYDNVYPKELHASLEFSGVIITSLNGGENANDSYRDDYNLDEYIRTSHSSNDYEWNRDYYSKGNWNSYDNDYRNPKWQVYFATEFIPKSKLSITNMSGTSRSLNFKFDLLNGMMITLSNDHLEENTFLCQWKTDYYFGKRVVLWNLAHEKAGEMRDLFMRTFEINGEAYIALNNFQLLRLKSGFAPIQNDYNQKSKYYTFEGLSGNNKILTRLKDENSQSTVLDPAYCIYLFKLVK